MARETLLSQEEIIGGRIRTRRKALDLSLTDLGEHLGITRQRMSQIEKGDFELDNPTMQRMPQELGYPAGDYNLLHADQAVEPDWLVKLRQQETAASEVAAATSAARARSKDEIAEALKTLRLARYLTCDDLDRLSRHPEATHAIERGGYYSDQVLRDTLAPLGLNHADELVSHVKTNGIEVPDMAKLDGRLEKLYIASRALRKRWDEMGATRFITYFPPGYQMKKGSFLALENPNASYGSPEEPPSLKTVMGVIAALHNADRDQLRGEHVLTGCAPVARVAAMANGTEPLPAYSRQFRRRLESAIDALAERAIAPEEVQRDGRPRR